MNNPWPLSALQDLQPILHSTDPHKLMVFNHLPCIDGVFASCAINVERSRVPMVQLRGLISAWLRLSLNFAFARGGVGQGTLQVLAHLTGKHFRGSSGGERERETY